MKIIDILNKRNMSLSFEVFPPKTDSAFEGVKKATEEIAALKPAFMSVTYGAGGGKNGFIGAAPEAEVVPFKCTNGTVVPISVICRAIYSAIDIFRSRLAYDALLDGKMPERQHDTPDDNRKKGRPQIA